MLNVIAHVTLQAGYNWLMKALPLYSVIVNT